MKKIRKYSAWILMAVPVIYLALIWQQLPAIVPVHYDLRGNPDRYGSRNELILMLGILTVVNIGVYLLITNVHRIDPKRSASVNRERMEALALGIVVFLTAIICVIIYTSAHPERRFNSNFILTAVGLLFAFIGNYMHNLRPNYFAGIRLPWTLENEENWKRTHALAGKLWFAGGMLIAILPFVLPVEITLFVVLAIVLTLVIIPSVYSYRFFKKSRIIQS